MKALKKSKGKFGIDGSPRGDNLFVWVSLTYTVCTFNAPIMITAQATCRLSKDPCRHKETWWWNEEVAEAVREKKKKYGNWKKRKINL